MPTFACGDGDQCQGEAAAVGDEIGELDGFARVRQRQHDVAGDDHAEVAVRGLGGVDEQRRGAGGGKGGGDLARHVAGLAHAADHDPARGTGQEVDGANETVVEGAGERAQARSLGREHVRATSRSARVATAAAVMV